MFELFQQFFHQEPARLCNHLCQTHKIKDNVLFKKLTRQAVPVMDEPVKTVEEDEGEGSNEEVQQYKEFKRFVTKMVLTKCNGWRKDAQKIVAAIGLKMRLTNWVYRR